MAQDRHKKALDKIRELEKQIQAQAQELVNVRGELDVLRKPDSGADLIEFVQEIAASKSKFAAKAKELLG